jgi:hypothetical protein
VRPELPIASVGSLQTTTATVDNSAPLACSQASTDPSGRGIQIFGATSLKTFATKNFCNLMLLQQLLEVIHWIAGYFKTTVPKYLKTI